MKFKIIISIFCLSLLVLPSSCRRNGNTLKDGYYTAIEEAFDSNGWKEFVTIRVSDGKIDLVEYDAFNESGFLRSWDSDFIRSMKSTTALYPNVYTRYYSMQFLEAQGIEGVDAISGASKSYRIFMALGKAVLEQALAGENKNAVVGIAHDED